MFNHQDNKTSPIYDITTSSQHQFYSNKKFGLKVMSWRYLASDNRFFSGRRSEKESACLIPADQLLEGHRVSFPMERGI